jgi:putative addiction module component (TIGR02574 family)
MNRDQIASEALQLDPRDRALLAEAIWESLGDPHALAPDLSDEEAVKLTIERNGEIESGKAAAVPHKEMMDRLRRDES